MKIVFHKKFLKDFKKLPDKIQNKFEDRLELFEREPFYPLLNNHSVDAVYPDWRSINISRDYRALFEIKDDEVIFMKIGTHAELYG